MYNDSFKTRFKKAPLAVSETVGEDTLPHIHKEFEMILVLCGNATVQIGKEEFVASKGDMVFVNPMEVHSLFPCKERPYLHKCICFDLSLLSDGGIRSQLADGTLTAMHLLRGDSDCCKDTAVLFQKLFSLADSEEQTMVLESSAYVSLMFADMIKGGILSGEARTDKESAFYLNVMKYIAENYANDISSQHPAKEMFYTQSHFCRVFNKNFGLPFSSFLNIYRITKAKEMLETSKDKVSDVASKCGFTNFSYFTKCFKKYVGISPSEYRKCQ